MTLSDELVDEACAFLRGKIRETFVERSPLLGERLGAPAWLKLENLQLTGSFKLRGAWFRLSRLSDEERARGVATCSAGNHGMATAFAAAELGVSAKIYVPSSVDRAKLDGMRALGADVVRSAFVGYDDTLRWALDQARGEGRVFVSAFEDDAIMAGNGGSLAVETLRQVPGARRFVVPVSGGGLAAGFAWVAKRRVPGAWLVGCQHVESPALRLSLDRGEAVTEMPGIETLAGGIEGGIGARNFEVIATRVDEVALVSEREIWHATAWLLAEHRYLVEPTGAVTLAACLSGKLAPRTDETVVVLSGRNVARSSVERILEGTR